MNWTNRLHLLTIFSSIVLTGCPSVETIRDTLSDSLDFQSNGSDGDSIAEATAKNLGITLPKSGFTYQFQILPNTQKMVYLTRKETSSSQLYISNLDGSGAQRIGQSMIASGTILDFKVTPNENRVVYLAVVHQRLGLFSVNLDGSGMRRLTPNQLAFAGIETFKIDPTGQYVVFMGDQFVNGVTELFSVRLGDGLLRRVNGDLVTSGRVISFDFAANRVIYLAKQDSTVRNELYASDFSGNLNVRLSPTLASDGFILPNYKTTASGRIAFTEYKGNFSLSDHDFYTVDAFGQNRIRMNDTLYSAESAGEHFEVFGNRIVFQTDEGIGYGHLYAADHLGANKVRLDTTLQNGFIVADEITFSSNGEKIAFYTKSNNGLSPPIGPYVVNADGSGTPALLPFTHSVGDVLKELRFDPSDQYVAFISDPATGFRRLLAGHTSGLISTMVNGNLQTDEEIISYQFGTNLEVYYLQGTLNRRQLHSGILGTISPTVVSPYLESGWTVQDTYQVDSTSGLVHFQLNQDSGAHISLYRNSADASSLQEVNAPMFRSEAAIARTRISHDGLRVVYLSDELVPGVDELWMMNIDGTQKQKISGQMTSGGDVFDDFQISENGSTIYYRADQDFDEKIELYSFDVVTGIRTRVSQQSSFNVSTFDVTSAGDRAVYQSNGQLFMVQKNGLNHTLMSTRRANNNLQIETFEQGFGITKNNLYVLMIDSQNDVLYSIRMSDLTETALSAASDGDVRGFMEAPQGNGVVYRLKKEQFVYHLFSVQLNGALRTRLTLAEGSTQTIKHVRITPDGTRVVFRSLYPSLGISAIYSSLTLGSGHVQLDPVFPGDFSQSTDFEISSNGTKVVFRGDFDSDQRFELYSVNIQGGNPLKLNGSVLATEGGVYRFQIAANNQAVYFADEQTTGMGELYRVNLNTGISTKISGGLPTRSRIDEGFVLADAGRTVLYAVDDRIAGVRELHSVDLTTLGVGHFQAPLGAGQEVGQMHVNANGSGAWFTSNAERSDRRHQLFGIRF